MRYFKFLIVTLFPITLVFGGTRTLEQVYILKSKSIIHVHITQAQERSFNLDGQVHMCGINYNARILASYKGNPVEDEIEFSSVFPLLVGEEYILMLGRPVAPASLIVELPMRYEAAFARCEENLFKLKVHETDALLISDYPYHLNGRWVMINDNIAHTGQPSMQRRPCLNGDGQCLFIQWDSLISRIKKSL